LQHAKVLVHAIQIQVKDIIFVKKKLNYLALIINLTLKSIKSIQNQPTNRPKKWEKFKACQNEI
jgi:hypothetical protein